MSDKNPIVLYIVARESLGMSAGKLAAQVGHVVQRLLFRYFMIQVLCAKKQLAELHLVSDEEAKNVQLLLEWSEHASTKIVKAASEKEWAALKDEFGKHLFIVKDAGKTELQPDTETVACIWPVRLADVPKSIWRLSNYK
jgi:peptidyl-tRNA hydrolase